MNAWQAAALTAAASAGKLKPLNHYLRGSVDKGADAAAMLAAFRGMQRKGIAVKIERIA